MKTITEDMELSERGDIRTAVEQRTGGRYVSAKFLRSVRKGNPHRSIYRVTYRMNTDDGRTNQ